MKNLILTIALTLFSSLCQSQITKIDNKFVLKSVYPSSGDKYSNDGELIRTSSNDGYFEEYRTSAYAIYYYKVGTQEMAIAVLLSFQYTDGSKSTCRGCVAKIDLANFAFKNGKWTNTLITKNILQNAGATYGERPLVNFKKFKNSDCINISYKSEGRNGTYESDVYFAASTHKLLNQKSTKISD